VRLPHWRRSSRATRLVCDARTQYGLPKTGGARAAPALDVAHLWPAMPARGGVCARLEGCAHEPNRQLVGGQIKQLTGERSKRAD
jgi:hypothetical protein